MFLILVFLLLLKEHIFETNYQTTTTTSSPPKKCQNGTNLGAAAAVAAGLETPRHRERILLLSGLDTINQIDGRQLPVAGRRVRESPLAHGRVLEEGVGGRGVVVTTHGLKNYFVLVVILHITKPIIKLFVLFKKFV